MRARIAEASRIVVKLGTHVVTRDGVEFALGRVTQIVEHLVDLKRQGKQVLLVSSGAVGLGVQMLGLHDEVRSLGMRQACAAAGQGRLIALYTQAFDQLGVKAAQVLLTQSDLADPDRALCLRTTLARLLELDAVPIVNENDSVSVRELVEWKRQSDEDLNDAEAVFGDNDGLSAKIAAGLDAELLILLSDVDGVYTANPKLDPEATRLGELEASDFAKLDLEGDSLGGTGGMRSKLQAASVANAAGVDVLIANGTDPDTLARVFRGEDVGTVILAPERPSRRKRRIALGGTSPGALILNAGAVQALTERKASLLPVGVTAVEGHFSRGDVLELRDGSGRVLGRGLVNYDAPACRKVAGKRSEEILDTLGYRGYDALITRDNLVLSEL
jgi:glutamate 5-kinase